MCQFLPFYFLDNIQSGCITVYLTEGHLGYFQFGVIVNNAAINVHVLGATQETVRDREAWCLQSVGSERGRHNSD